MKHNKVLHQNEPAVPAGFSRRGLLPLIASLAAITALGAITSESRAFGQVPSGCAALGVPLKPGDTVYADSGDAIHGGFIVKVDGLSSQSSVISCGGLLRLPFGVVIDGNGQIVVSDSGRLIRIDPVSGNQALIADNSGGALGWPYGIALNRNGGILAANLAALLQVDPFTGQIQNVSAGGHPLAVSVANNGQLFVINVGSVRQILRVNPQTGAQRLVTQGGFLKNPQAIVVQGNDIYVTDVATSDGNFGVGCIIHVDAQSGAQTVISGGTNFLGGANLIGPVGIAFDANGELIVGDPYTVNPQSPNLVDGGYDGAIIRIDPYTGNQTVLARGQGSFVNPRGVAVVLPSVLSHN